MPTIDQLAPATATSDNDELIVNQSGITRRATRTQVLAGVQPQLVLPSGSVLGRATAGVGNVETLTVGANLLLSGGTLSATAAAYSVTQLPAGTVPTASDLVPLGQGGSDKAVPLSQFADGLVNVGSLNASGLLVEATGSGTAQTLGDFAAGVLRTAGGTMSGALTLAGDPSHPSECGHQSVRGRPRDERTGPVRRNLDRAADPGDEPDGAPAGSNQAVCRQPILRPGCAAPQRRHLGRTADPRRKSRDPAAGDHEAVCRRRNRDNAAAERRNPERGARRTRQPIDPARCYSQGVRRRTVCRGAPTQRWHHDRGTDPGWRPHQLRSILPRRSTWISRWPAGCN